MRSSIFSVEIGSSALAGSSIRITSGLMAMVLAMQSRCCWPPDSDKSALIEFVFYLVPQCRLTQRTFDQARRCCRETR